MTEESSQSSQASAQEKKPWDGYQRSALETELLRVLEEKAACEDMNIESLVNEYKKHFPGQAIWRLTNDMQRQALVWHNVVERLKKANFGNMGSPPGDVPIELMNMKEWYEKSLVFCRPTLYRTLCGCMIWTRRFSASGVIARG